ncbi:MAG: SDR family NAD(P)-dependent oxidoreductase, partial [Microbacterium sp.]
VGDGAAVGGFQTAEQVVTRAMRALDARSRPASVVSGWRNVAMTTASRLLPRRAALAIAGRVVR